MFRFPLIVPLVAVLLHLAADCVHAEAFAPPMPYPAERYEGGWMMNPFTLKTAPTAVQRDSFAKDLAIQAHYGSVERPIVSIVNTKTRERTRLSPGETDKDGMLLKAVHVKPSRKETYAEVVMNGETAVVRYDNAFIAQMASHAAPVPAGQAPQTGLQGQVVPGGASNAVAMNAGSAGGVNRTLNSTANATGATGTPGAGAAAAKPSGAYTPNPYSVGAPPPVNVNAGPAPANVPTPMRRRLLTAPVAPSTANPPR